MRDTIWRMGWMLAEWSMTFDCDQRQSCISPRMGASDSRATVASCVSATIRSSFAGTRVPGPRFHLNPPEAAMNG